MMALPGGSFWNAERLSILLGFTLTLLSLLGAQFYLGPAQVQLTAIADNLAATRTQVQILATAQALDNAYGQLGSMVFTLNANESGDENRADIIAALQRRAIERRHEGVRNYLAQLGLAGAIDFLAMSSLYDQLVTAEQRDFSLATYQAANEFERELSMAIVNKMGQKAIGAIRLHSDWVHAANDVKVRSAILLAMSTAGLVLLFFATLWAERDAAPSGTPGDQLVDRNRTLRILSLARDELHRRAAQATLHHSTSNA